MRSISRLGIMQCLSVLRLVRKTLRASEGLKRRSAAVLVAVTCGISVAWHKKKVTFALPPSTNKMGLPSAGGGWLL